MKDNEIIKALECCYKDGCKECPLWECKGDCFEELIKENVLDLINRQKAENERLKKIIVGFMDEVGTWSNKYDVDISNIHKLPLLAKEDYNIKNKIKSEAIKEFERKSEDRLIEIYEKYHQIANNTQLKEGVDMFYQGRAEAIWECIGINRNLVKEMTEGSK